MNFMSKKGENPAHYDEDKKMNRPIQVIFGLCNAAKRQNHWTSLTKDNTVKGQTSLGHHMVTC